MPINDIRDELATLKALILEDCTLWPTSDYGLSAVPGTLYAGEDFLATIDPNQASQLIARYWPDIHHAAVIRIDDLTIFINDDPIVLAALLTLEHNHD